MPQTDSQETWNTYHGLLDRYYANQGRFYELKELDRRRNQEAKEALIARAEALKDAPGINKALDELKKLHDEWKHIGPVPEGVLTAHIDSLLAAAPDSAGGNP